MLAGSIRLARIFLDAVDRNERVISCLQYLFDIVSFPIDDESTLYNVGEIIYYIYNSDLTRSCISL